MLKFKKNARQEHIDRFIEEIKKLPHLNPEVRDYSHGWCVEPRFHSGDFDFANCCDIDSYEAMERYMSHWAHLRMTPFLPDILENMISFDWEIDYRGPAFDPEKAAAEALKEAARVQPVHDDSAKAIVPEVRGKPLARAKEMLAIAGLELNEDIQWILGSVWAPDRVMVCTPEQGTEVDKGTRVTLGITGDWLCGAEPAPEQSPW